MTLDFWANILAGIIAGFVSGGVGGAIAAYILRRIGSVDCEITGWHMAKSGVEEAYAFSTKFFNRKEVSTALWNLRVVCYDAATGEEIASYIGETWQWTQGTGGHWGKRSILDLPPGVTVTTGWQLQDVPGRLSGIVENDSVTVKLTGTFAGGEHFERTVPREVPSPTTAPPAP